MTAIQKLPMMFHPQMPKHFMPNLRLGQFLRWFHLELDGMGNSGRHWLVRENGVIVAQYWPADARLHIHKDGSSEPTQKYQNVAPDDLPDAFGGALGMDPMDLQRTGPPTDFNDNGKTASDVIDEELSLETVPREEVSSRKDLKRAARIKILAIMVSHMMANPKIYTSLIDNTAKLIAEAEKTLMAIEDFVDQRDLGDIEDLQGK